MSERIDVLPIQAAVKSYLGEGHTYDEICKEIGWLKPCVKDGKLYGDTVRLRRCLGLADQQSKRIRSNGRGVIYRYRNRHISYDNAVLIIRAIGRMPVEFDV